MNNPNGQFQVEIQCPNCAKEVDFMVRQVFDWIPLKSTDYPYFVEAVEASRRPRRQINVDDKRSNHLRQDGTDKITAYGFGTCPKCYQPAILIFNSSAKNLSFLQNVDLESALVKTSFAAQYITLLGMVPSAKKYTAPSALPERISQLWLATQASLDRGDPPSRIVSECRSILDVSLKELGEVEGGRKTRIKNLRDKFILTDDLMKWANELWEDGNDAVHDIEADGSTAQQHVEFLRLFFRIVFELPAEIEAKQHIATT